MPTRPSTRCTRRPGATRPVVLAINDYNTEQAGKRQRLHDLVDAAARQRRAGRRRRPSVPPQPVDTGRSLEDAIVAFEDLPVTQVVSELDVTTGTPVTEALSDRPGLLLPRRVPDLPRPHRRPVLGDRVGPHRQPQLAGRRRRPAPVRRRAAGEAGLPRRRRRRAPAAATVGVRVHGRQRPEHGVDRVGVAAAARDRRRHRASSCDGAPTRSSAYVRVSDATVDATDAITFVVDGATLHRPSRRRRRRAGAGRRSPPAGSRRPSSRCPAPRSASSSTSTSK